MGMVQDLSDPGKRLVGTKQVIKYASESAFKKVFIAKDADEELIERLKETCEKHRVEYDMSHTMQQIGNASGIEVGSACAAVRR